MTDERSAVGAGTPELEQLRQELETTRRKLAEAYKMVSIGRLVTGIIHEINTPIGSILSNNEVTLRCLAQMKKLLAGSGAPERVHEILETAASLAAVDKIACERISSVVRSLKTFARVDEGDLRQADLNEILRNTIKLSDCEFRRRVQVHTEFGDLPAIECYPQLLNQVFLNLLVNAGQSIEGEGEVRVRTWRDDACAHVTIADTGHGIKPEDRERIFATGFSTKPLGIGTGLGLAMSREIVVDAHHGEIEFQSEVGVGTTFHVRIPIRQREPAAE